MSETSKTAAQLIEPAPAKLNLTLRVGAPRSDGYHPLDSLVMFADWGDEIRVRPSKAVLLEMSGPYAGQLKGPQKGGGGNLVLMAVRALQDAAGYYGGAVVHLRKEIPVAGGLGGGSADAAATLRALNELWKLGATTEDLAVIGLSLGADVPACVVSHTLRMTGIGENLQIINDASRYPALIVNPGDPVPTGPVFKAYDSHNPPPLAEVEYGGDLLAYIAEGGNDLERPAIEIAPSIRRVLEALIASEGCALARMSGSGASCFGLFQDEASAQAAAAALSAAEPGWFVRPVTLGAPQMPQC